MLLGTPTLDKKSKRKTKATCITNALLTKVKSMPANRPRALRKGSLTNLARKGPLTSKLARPSPKVPQSYTSHN
eukprot:1148468-Pelagomonas_calceolata.AAC.8